MWGLRVEMVGYTYTVGICTRMRRRDAPLDTDYLPATWGPGRICSESSSGMLRWPSAAANTKIYDGEIMHVVGVCVARCKSCHVFG